MLDNFGDKKILILGFGREGVDTLMFFRRLFPKKIFGVGDRLEFQSLKCKVQNLIRRDRKIKLHLGKNYLQALKDYEVIIKSPGIPPKAINPFVKKGQQIVSQTKIFFDSCPGQIIGVTGTKGKSTTASLIYRVLKEGGVKAHLIGNVGKPVLSFLFLGGKDDVYVYELSSHQLAGLKKSPRLAVFLNLYPEHLDYYRDFKEYARAKANICLYQTNQDYLIFNQKNKFINGFAEKSQARKIPIEVKNIGKIISRKDIPLIGEFNLDNVAAAIEVGKVYRLPPSKIRLAIKHFKPLPHRLELVGTYKGITFYNDSLATVPEATIGAINALDDNLKTLISGGFDRGLGFENLSREILESGIKTIIFFPTTGQKIWQEIERMAKKLKPKKMPLSFFVNKMTEAVRLAYQNSKRGDVCLLSCASASFNLFKDYRERGNLFKQNVKRFGRL